MSQLKVSVFSTMTSNLTKEWETSELYGTGTIGDWYTFIKSLPNVVDAVFGSDGPHSPCYTLITFESEADRNWFLLRWS